MELKCPHCNGDMKEYITCFMCRNCHFKYNKKFQPKEEGDISRIRSDVHPKEEWNPDRVFVGYPYRKGNK